MDIYGYLLALSGQNRKVTSFCTEAFVFLEVIKFVRELTFFSLETVYIFVCIIHGILIPL